MEADSNRDKNQYNDEVCFFGVKPAKVPVDEMRELPHSLLGVITMDIEGSSDPGVGTGILISPNLVLTAAHNLWNKGKPCDNFRFYLAHNGLLGQSYFKVKSCYFPDEFT